MCFARQFGGGGTGEQVVRAHGLWVSLDVFVDLTEVNNAYRSTTHSKEFIIVVA